MSEKQDTTFLYNVDTEKVEKLLTNTNVNVQYFDALCSDLIKGYSQDLDEIVEKFHTKNKEYKERQLEWSDEELEDIFLELSGELYFAGEKLERLGIHCDMAKAQRQEVYNKAYLENQIKDPTDKKNKTTVAENASVAEESSKYETVVNSIYDRVYKTFKYKIDAAFELLSSIKKIISKRMQDQSSVFDNMRT